VIKRILDIEAKDLRIMNKYQKLESIVAAEGRTIVSETIGCISPVLLDISNVELAAAFGADIILLNMYDVNNPLVLGLPINESDSLIKRIKEITGRMVGVNLEPFDSESSENSLISFQGRSATIQNAKKAVEQGADIILLTGNPKTGVTNNGIVRCLSEITSACVSDVIIAAGKMHSAGQIREGGNRIINEETVKQFIDSGADIVLLPAPGTVPGVTTDYIKGLIDYIHYRGVMAMTSIGTSQEGSDEDTIRRIALNCKIAGADLHHIGDSGMTAGIANPENIMIYSIAIKGKRHTYRRMARSANR